MKIETRFNVCDEVWLMHENKPTAAKVFSIRIVISNITGSAREEYSLCGANVPGSWAGNTFIAPTLLFKSREDLLASL